MFENQLLLAAISWAAGILAAVVVQQIINRRKVLTYFVQHQNLGSSADDQTFGNVRITWNGADVPNLYLSTVSLTNESSKDLENVKIRAYTNDTLLLSEFPQLVGTTEFVRYSPEFDKQISVEPGETPTDAQMETYRRQREYIIPVMNRGQIVRFQYLNTSKTPDQPTIWLESIHPGTILKFQVPQTLVHGVPQAWASLAGVISGIVFAAMLAAYSPNAALTAFGALLFGLIAQLPGAYIVRIIRLFRQWLTG